jgi:hypothetical protein
LHQQSRPRWFNLVRLARCTSSRQRDASGRFLLSE